MKDFMQLHRTLKLRILMNFLGALCFSTVGSSMTIYYNQYLGAGLTGVLLIVSSVMVFFVGLYAGHLTDRHGRRPLMLFATLVTTAGAAVATLSNSPWFFNAWTTYFGFLILNFGFGFFNTASQAMIVDLTTADNRRVVYSLQYWVINMAILFGSGLSGWFFRDHLFALLLAITIEEAISFLLVLTAIPESFDSRHSPAQKESIFRAYRVVSRDRIFMLYCFASVFIAMIFNQIDYYLPVHLADSFTRTRLFGIELYGQRELTLILVVNTGIIVVAMSLINRLTRYWTRRTGIGVGIVLQGAGYVLFFLFHSFTPLLVAALIETVGEMILVPSSQALRADLMEGDRVGTYTGVFSITQPIASVLSGLLLSGSAAYGNIGMAAFMLLIILLAVLPATKAIAMREKPGAARL